MDVRSYGKNSVLIPEGVYGWIGEIEGSAYKVSAGGAVGGD